MDKTIINYRFVVNDAVCNSWEPMPEIPGKDIAALVEYLKKCKNTCDRLGEPWDFQRLIPCRGFDAHIIDYGLRSQFYLPVLPDDSDFTWRNKNKITVRCCGQEIEAIEDYDCDPVCADEGYLFACLKCGRHTRKENGRLHKTISAAKEHWEKIYR